MQHRVKSYHCILQGGVKSLCCKKHREVKPMIFAEIFYLYDAAESNLSTAKCCRESNLPAACCNGESNLSAGYCGRESSLTVESKVPTWTLIHTLVFFKVWFQIRGVVWIEVRPPAAVSSTELKYIWPLHDAAESQISSLQNAAGGKCIARNRSWIFVIFPSPKIIL